MKVYNREGQSMTAEAEQLEALQESGWSRTKPEAKEEIVVKSPVVTKPTIKKAKSVGKKKPSKIKKK